MRRCTGFLPLTSTELTRAPLQLRTPRSPSRTPPPPIFVTHLPFSGLKFLSFNLLTKDAIPELSIDCSPTDPNADKAQQCRDLRGATFDVIGHLRQVQPARPRWVVIPRDPDDVCCYPGPGLECPRVRDNRYNHPDISNYCSRLHVNGRSF